MSSAGRLIPAKLPFAVDAATFAGFSTVLVASSCLAVTTAVGFSTGFGLSTGDFGGGGMLVPSVILPKLRSRAGNSKRELAVPLETFEGILKR